MSANDTTILLKGGRSPRDVLLEHVVEEQAVADDQHHDVGVVVVLFFFVFFKMITAQMVCHSATGTRDGYDIFCRLSAVRALPKSACAVIISFADAAIVSVSGEGVSPGTIATFKISADELSVVTTGEGAEGFAGILMAGALITSDARGGAGGTGGGAAAWSDGGTR